MKPYFHLMNGVSRRLTSVLFILCLLQVCGVPLGAATIYSHSFGGSGAAQLHGQAPDIRPGAETWTAHPRWKADGSASTPSGSDPANAFLPFVPTAGLRYTLAADVNPTAGGGDWMALGFSTAHTTNNGFHVSGNSPVGWMLLRNTRGAAQGQSFLGPGGTSGVSYDSPAGVVNLKVILDTTRPMWTVQFFVNNAAVRGPIQFSGSNPGVIYAVMGAYNSAAGTVDNFSLTSDPDSTTLLVNGSFEADTFASSPGSVSANTAITGWSVTDSAKGGLNPAGGVSAIIQNGAVPDGTKVAWLQCTNILSTVINGLTPGSTYTISFRANARTAATTTNRPALKLALSNIPGLFDAVGINPVGGANPYHFISVDFTASAASHTLYVTNNQAGTNYLALDDFKINVSTSGWSYARWTNDASAGVDNTKNYTHAYAFATASSPVISNVTFRGIAGANPNVPYELVTSGLGSTAADAANVLKTAGGGSGTLASQMVYGGNPAVFALQGLVPGMQYVAKFYGVAWDPKNTTRPVTWIAGTDRLSVNEDQFDNDVGIIVSHAYTAPSNGVMLFTNLPIVFSTSLTTFHTYGLANYEAATQTVPVIGVNPKNVTAVPGSMASFYGTAGGARPLSYRWLSNGVVVTGQTNRYLTVTNVDALATGTYALWVSNNFGMVTSAVANLTLDTATYPIVNPSFEKDTFAQYPGTISGNQAISGWTATDATKVGISPAGGIHSYGVNGTVPDGNQVAFIQGAASLGTTISGLTPATTYTVSFRANSYSGNCNVRPLIDSVPVFLATVDPVGSTNAYKHLVFNFTATSATHTLTVSNEANILLVDDFRINVSTSAWSYAVWTNDASAGIDTTKTYTHAYNFNNTTNAIVQGVTFRGSTGGNPSRAGHFAAIGYPSAFTADTGNVLVTNGGGSGILARDFIYGGNPEILAISNLVPFVEYVATIYGVCWTDLNRASTFSFGTDRLTVNEGQFGNAPRQGIRVSLRYTADSSGTALLNVTPTLSGNTFHTYGFANYEYFTTNAPTYYTQPSTAPYRVTIGSSVLVSNFVIGGVQPVTLQWQFNGTNLVDQTNAWLSLQNVTLAEDGIYTLVASNSQGVTVSSNFLISIGYINNPSFEVDTFTVFPGYVSANFPITGWSNSVPTRSGINPASGSPFADNGVIPDGNQVGFLQSTSSMSTVMVGFNSNQTYTVSFRVNARNGQKPNLHVAIDDQPVVDMLLSSVGGTNAYKYASFDFTATNWTHTLSLTNDAAGDHTVVIDDFRVNVSTSRWSFAIWTNDTSAGIDLTRFYTHAYNFGSVAEDAVVNGQTFVGLAGTNPAVAGKLVTAGFPNTYAGPDANILTGAGGGSAVMAQRFIYGGAIQSITLSNLIPGLEYVATIYGVGFDLKSYGRAATFSVGTDRMTINEGHFDNDMGIRISYRYVANSNGTVTLTYVPTDSTPSSIHTYGFANYQLTDTPPFIGAQPQGTNLVLGDSALLTANLSGGSQPLTYQWQLNGVNLTDQTNATLLATPPSIGTNNYQVIITNLYGAVTSSVASIRSGLAITESFNTGMDDQRGFLPANSMDPHYLLIYSDDPSFPGPGTFVLRDEWPVAAGAYPTNGPLSKWIGPRSDLTNVAGSGNLPGTYIYRTTLIFDTLNPTNAVLQGKWMTDNVGLDVLLNGVSLGFSNTAQFVSFAPFVISNTFLPGSNTLDFVISNAAPTGPTALRVELYGVGMPLPPSVPQIVNQPADQTVVENADSAFIVMATGSGPLSYQWYTQGYPLLDETNRILRLSNVSFDMIGDYQVVIANSEGSVTSLLAFLMVEVPAYIDIPPQSQTVTLGSNAVFGVAAGGTAITYQWYFGINPITDQTNASLTVNNAQLVDQGLYWVRVSNFLAVVDSPAAQLTVNQRPVAVAKFLRTFQDTPVSVPVGRLIYGDSDPENDAITITSVSANSTNMGVVGMTNGVVTYAPPMGQTGTDLFTYTLTDARGATATGQVFVEITPASASSLNLISASLQGGHFLATFAGIPGLTYTVDRATNAAGPWNFFTNVTASTNGVIAIDDPNDPPEPVRFYRTRYP